MNFKQRGITVGDLLLFIVLIIFISLISLKFKDKNDQSNLLNRFSQNKSIIFKS